VILSQLSSSVANFTPKSIGNTTDKDIIAQFNSYRSAKRDLSILLEFEFKQNTFTGQCLCTCWWVSALNVLQNKTCINQLEYVNYLLDEHFFKDFKEKILEQKNIPMFLAILDIIEMLMFSFVEEMNLEMKVSLIKIMNTLIDLVEISIPTEGAVAYKKLCLNTIYDYEKVLFCILRLCLVIFNVLPMTDSVLAVAKLKRIIILAQEMAINSTSSKYFQYMELYSFASYALDLLALNTTKNRITNQFPSTSTVFRSNTLDNSLLYDSSIP
jgi:hypothetical protein